MTPRQKLLNVLTRKLTIHNTKATLCENGKEYSIDGYKIVYKTIRPNTKEMNELVEEIARNLGDAVWQYYLNMSDFAYNRLTIKAYKLS